MSIAKHRVICSCVRYLMIACTLLMESCLFGCAAQTPPPPRDQWAPVFEGREAVVPGERIDVRTDSGEHFEATVLSVSEDGFKVTDKKELEKPPHGNDDAKRLSYEFAEVTSVSTIPRQQNSEVTSATVILGVAIVAVVGFCIWLGHALSGLAAID
jgi:hypothetical protein